jgi:polysaccharide export outer membrane protein
MIERFRFSLLPVGTASLAALLLSGCASLPSNGPTANQIVKRSSEPDASIHFDIVPLTAADLVALNASASPSVPPLVFPRPAEVGVIGPGDILQISLFEVGVSLFGRDTTNTSGLFDPSAHSEKLPSIIVNQAGYIRVPFAGDILAAGQTPDSLSRYIEWQFKGKSQAPQVVISIASNVSNIAYVSGAVRKPGRLDLTLGHERLLDAVAISGGSTGTPEDSIVRIVRGTQTVEMRLSDISVGGPENFVLSPGDRIEVLNRPRSYLAMGATGKVSQISFEANELSLVEAIARASGPSDAAADPTAIFLFRDQAGVPTGAGGEAARPVIYRINMMEPSTYLLAQRLRMRDKDVLYFANARANQPSKLIGLLNQLFSPFVTARAVTR